MYTLDTALLQECGVRDLNEAAQQDLLARLHADLEYRVGVSLSKGMAAGAIDEFTRPADAHEHSVTRWLERHRADYRVIVARTLAALKDELTVDPVGTVLCLQREHRFKDGR